MSQSFFIGQVLYMFRASHHPSSGAQTIVTTASGNGYTVLLSAAIVEELERLPDAVVTIVLCS
jgi:L-asparaginase/Glu-tRNA(Gln) amidotransferase subunit D